MLPDDPSLRRRILGAGVLVVVLPFVFIYTFVAVVNHVFVPLLESMGHGPFHGRFYVDPIVATLLVVGGLVAQAWYGPRQVLASVSARRAPSDRYPELHATITRLAQQVDIEPPQLAVVHTDAPNAMAVRGPNEAAIVVTTGLLHVLDEDEREAVIAHEVAHLKHRDATVMTVAWLLPTITYYLATAAAYVLYGLYRALGSSGGSSRKGKGVAQVVLILTVTAVVTLAVSAMFWAASVLVHRVLGRYREYAADRGAAALTGNPSALASALRRLDETMPNVPDRDLRRLDGGAEALCIAPLEGRAFTDAELVSTDIFPETHPPTERRIRRLQELTRAVS